MIIVILVRGCFTSTFIALSSRCYIVGCWGLFEMDLKMLQNGRRGKIRRADLPTSEHVNPKIYRNDFMKQHFWGELSVIVGRRAVRLRDFFHTWQGVSALVTRLALKKPLKDWNHAREEVNMEGNWNNVAGRELVCGAYKTLQSDFPSKIISSFLSTWNCDVFFCVWLEGGSQKWWRAHWREIIIIPWKQCKLFPQCTSLSQTKNWGKLSAIRKTSCETWNIEIFIVKFIFLSRFAVIHISPFLILNQVNWAKAHVSKSRYSLNFVMIYSSPSWELILRETWIFFNHIPALSYDLATPSPLSCSMMHKHNSIRISADRERYSEWWR